MCNEEAKDVFGKKNVGFLLRLVMLMMGLIIVVSATACANNNEKSASNAPSEEAAQYDRVADNNQASSPGSPPLYQEGSARDTSVDGGENASPFPERMIMYHVRISAVVADYKEARNQIEKQIASYQGYIVNSSEYHSENHSGASMTLRIPQQKMQPFIEFVEKNSVESTYEIGSQEVTEEYVDLTSRLKAKQAMEARLFEFMDKAEKAEDLLKISQDLGRVQEEIEQIKGRVRYLQEHTSYSTIDLSFSEKKTSVEAPGSGTLTKAWHAFIDSSNNVVSFFVGLFILLIGMIPFLLVLLAVGLPVFLVWRRIHKRQKKDPMQEQQ